MKHSYVRIFPDGVLRKYNVEMEERYHHRRPDDKSIGRADEGSDSVFYQISSICAGQKFQGFITGSERQIKRIYDAFTEESGIQIGYGKTSEYGRCTIRVISVDTEPEKVIRGHEFWIQLVSPAILYNERAFYTTNLEDLKEEIKAALGIEQQIIDGEITCYIKLTTVGGYNVTWQMRKPTVEAFDKGTVVHIKLKEEAEFPAHEVWIGERNAQGYGEIAIQKVQEEGDYLKENKIWGTEKKTEQDLVKLNLENKPFLTEVAGSLFQSFMEYQAACDVSKSRDELSERAKPTVQNMLLMCQDAKTMEDVEKAAEKRFEKSSEHKQKKGEEANKILDHVRTKAKELIKDFQEQQGLEDFSYHGDVEFEYLKQYLLQLKYELRKKEMEKTAV